MHQPQYSSLYNAILIFVLFQKRNQSHSPPQSAKSKFGSNLPFVWNDIGIESWNFSDHEEDQPDCTGSCTVAMRILSLVQARYILRNWGGLVPHRSVFWMNYPFHCSLIMYTCADTCYTESELVFALSRAATMGTLSCAYSACSYWELVLCVMSPLCLYDTQ